MFCKKAEALTTATFTKSTFTTTFAYQSESTTKNSEDLSPDAYSIIIHTIKQLHVGNIRGSFDICIIYVYACVI